jgi:LPXTG-motif cell wall-anchored protein
MVLAACVAFWRGWQIHTGQKALMAYALGVAALALAVWHFTRRRV